MSTHYVAGFLFNSDATAVALVRKARPEWQAGKLNGIGGHIEAGESATDAMRREFREEAGVALGWSSKFAVVQGPWGSVSFFRAFSSTSLSRVKTLTDERIEVRDVDDIPWGECLPNLSWLIPLARYRRDLYETVLAAETNGWMP